MVAWSNRDKAATLYRTTDATNVSISFVSEVPDDVLNTIFEIITIPSYPESSVIYEVKSAFTLAAVSRRWRQLLLLNPKIWASLVATDLLPETINTIISRAGACPLTLWVGPLEHGPEVSVDMRISSYAKVFEHIPKCKAIHILLTRAEDILSRQAFIDAVRARAPTIHSFTLDLRSYSSQTLLPLESFNLFGDPPGTCPAIEQDGPNVTHMLKVLHVRGPPAHTASLSLANRLPNLTSLVLQGSPRITAGQNPHGPSHLFTPHSFITFISMMKDLRVLVLDNVIQWSEPTMYNIDAIEDVSFRKALYTEAAADLPNTVDLPHLTNFEVTTEVFTAMRLLAGFKELRSSCRTILRVFSNAPTTWDLARFKNALLSFLRLVTKERGVDTWSFAFGSMFLIRAEKQGRVLCDIRVDLVDFLMGATSLGVMYDAFEATLPSFLAKWDLESATTLRLRLEPDSSMGNMGWSGHRWDFARGLFRRCTSVTKLHLHGISLAAYSAISDSYLLPPLTLHHTLPNLAHLVVIASSFHDGPDSIHSSDYRYLANILAARAEKRGVPQIKTFILVDNLTGEDGYNILTRSVVPHFSPFDCITFAWTDAAGYHRSDPGVQPNCDACRSSGFWYSVTTDVMWRLEGEHVVRRTCVCVLKTIP
ncbi:hypothetical protein CC1G_09762 [Coprinopsis cinerea okayama7|uniref:F-box domain-containing protein n=1 Tax=Coprinopsis cinerea (strain Okayama-7 / 130 / ATCC MYA-4618 / FGSC 9003) TaxID=240176 RepID=A8PE25_COPC7|nr:hypothetical protein CC1G_09762 [Coprinopsis cinerea okayama7\|eukprot:XP_001840711.1 hypothetical protein CC1G_09762 [Coprinopsis cinerea okayama7\